MKRMTWAALRQKRMQNTARQKEYQRTVAALSFGQNVRAQRLSAGLSEADLAAQLSADPETVERIELGDADVAPELLARAAMILGVKRGATPTTSGPQGS